MATEIRPRPPQGLSRGRLVLVAALAAAVVALLSARGLAGFYTDYLWFDSIGFTSIWKGLLWAKVGLVILFMALAFALVWVNVFVADRLAPAFRPPGPEEAALEPVNAVFDRRPALTAGGGGVPAGAARRSRGRVATGTTGSCSATGSPSGSTIRSSAATSASTCSSLPFVSFLVDWLFGALVVVTLVTMATHYRNGGIRLQVPGRLVTPAVRAHLSILLACIALVRAVSYYLDRFEITFSTRGVVDGATYTDVNANLPAINLLIAISVLAAGLLLYNVRRRGWVLPGIAVGLWLLVAVVVGTAYPAFIQRFRVEPAESVREAPFIERNIAATRAALGLADVTVRPFAYNEELSAEALQKNSDTIRNVRLWDPQVLRQTYQRLQEVRTFYRFTDVDIDRYGPPGARTQTMLSARELNPESLPSDTWENRHLAFTHGYGAVMSPANAVTSDGQPDFLVKDIPPQGEPPIAEPRLYHGESIGGLRHRQQRPGRDRLRQGRRHRRHQPVRRAGRRRHRLDRAAGRLRTALRRRQPADLGLHDPRVQDPLRSGHPGAGPDRRAVPPLRRRPLPGAARGSDRLDHGRLHHHHPLPLRPAGRP